MTSEVDQALAAAVEKVAQAKIAEALGGDVLGKIITGVMEHRDSGYGRDNKTQFERLVEGTVRDMIHRAIKTYLEERREELESSIKTALASKGDEFASSIIDAFVSEDWRATLEIKINRESL